MKSSLWLVFLILFTQFLDASEVLAIVNGEKITTEVAPKNFKTLDKDTKQKIIKRLIEKKLASDFALSHKEITNSKEFKKVLEHVFKMSKKPNKDKSLANLLKENATFEGYTKEQLASKKGLLAFDFILDKKAKEFENNTEEIKKYYEQNRYKYDTPAMYELLTIVVDDKNLANKIYEELKSSKNRVKTFENLAKKYSLAPSNMYGGYFGKIPKDSLNELLKKSLNGLKRGNFTKPIKTEFGYQIFYLLNDIPEFKSTFETVEYQVKNDYLRKKVKEWAIKKINELKNSSDIKIVYR